MNVTEDSPSVATMSSLTASSHHVLRILLADDSPPILKMTSSMLKKLGHQVTLAENGAIAVKHFEENKSTEGRRVYFDLILIDLQMPVMDGLEAIKRIRALEQDSDRDHRKEHSMQHKIIGLSANDDEETCQQALQAGADAFLAKPWKMEELMEIYRQI
jgi:CheY-like chemotaxis protein